MFLTINNTKLKYLKVQCLLIFLVFFLKFEFSAYAASIALTWDVNSDADYYVVYWGTSKGNLPEDLENPGNSGKIGKVTSYTATIPDGIKYYFAVKAFNSCGNSSDFSDWVASKIENNPPIANAGAAQTIAEGSIVTLDGAGSYDADTGDAIVSYQWVQTAGTSVTLSAPNIVKPSFIAPEVGVAGSSLNFLLTVADNNGLQVSASCIVNVKDKASPNTAPIANAGIAQTIIEGSLVTLDGSGSYDADTGDAIVSYQWVQTAGTSVTFSAPNVAKPSFTAPDVSSSGASMSFLLTVADNNGLQASNNCIVNVKDSGSQNTAPVARAGSAQLVQKGSLVILDASGSYDSDTGDTIVSYQWTQTEGPQVILSNANSAKSSFTAPDAGDTDASLIFSLVVADNDGLRANDACLVKVITGDLLPVPGDLEKFTPIPLSNITTTADNYPSIEVFNKKFEHLEWLKTGWPEYNDFSGVAHVAMGDIDGSGTNEIIIGLATVESQNSMPGGLFQIIDENYSHLAWGRVQWSEYNLINGETWPTCGDIDGDGVDEIIIGFGIGGQGYFEIFKYNAGELVHFAWGHIDWNEYNFTIGETRPVCADIDGDGADEIIVGLGKGANSGMPAGKFEIFDNDLTHLSWGELNWLEYNEINGETWPAPGDVDGDGNIEIIVGLGAGGKGRMGVFEFEEEDLVQSQWAIAEWPEYNEVSGETRPVCADIDEDQNDEIIVGLGRVSGQTDIPGGFFLIIDDDFTLMEWGQINSVEFNKINGESVLAKGSINDADKIIVGLGSWDIEEDEDNSPGINDIIDIEDGAVELKGCFINSSGLYY